MTLETKVPKGPKNREEIFIKLRRALSVSAATAALLPMAVAATPASQAAPAAKIPTCYDLDTAYGQYHDNTFVGRSFGIPKSGHGPTPLEFARSALPSTSHPAPP